MRHAKGRRIAFGLVLVGLAAGGLAVWVGRDELLERWWIQRLGSTDAGVRAAAARKLGAKGGERAARAIVEGLVHENALGEEAVTALEGILERVRPEARVWMMHRILDALRKGHTEGGIEIVDSFERKQTVGDLLPGFVHDSAGRYPELVQALVDALETEELVPTCVNAILGTWPRGKPAVDAFLARATPSKVASTIEAIAMKKGDVREIFTEWGANHPRAEVRAASLAKAFAMAPADRSTSDLISRAYLGDPDPIVKQMAIKLASMHLVDPGPFAFEKLLLEERDPVLLATVIEAMTRAAATKEAMARIEAAPGIVVRLFERSTAAETLRPWAPAELERLSEILSEATDSRLRDAASAALATALESSSQSEFAADSRRPKERRPLAGFEVHEWGVWSDGAGSIEPVRKSLDELPALVHRTAVTPQDLAVNVPGPPGTVRLTGVNFKPIIFFHSQEPISAIVRVAHLGGMPWAFFPDASNYIVKHAERSRPDGSELYIRPEAAPILFTASSLVSKRIRFSGSSLDSDADQDAWAPWLREAVKGYTTPPAGRPVGRDPEAEKELAGKFQWVPWEPYGSTDESMENAAGIGLEWRGLRIGYPARLESEPPALPTDGAKPSWWKRLREVPATPVSFRGQAERFLFYDGSIRLPSPVEVRWTNPTHSAVTLRTRDFCSLPQPEDWQGRSVRSFVSQGELFQPSTAHLPAVVVVSKKPDHAARGHLLRHFGSSAPREVVQLEGIELEGDALAAALRDVLTGEGLTADEAQSLVDVWRPQFLEASGLRVLTVLPQWLYEAVLPIEVVPVPEKVTRVGIVWKECTKLELETPAAGNPPTIFGDEEPVTISTTKLEVLATPLEPSPPIPFEIDPSGRLVWVSPGNHTMLLSEDGRSLAHPHASLTGMDIYIADLAKREFRSLHRFPAHFVLEDYGFSWDGRRVSAIFIDAGRKRLFVIDRRDGLLREYVGMTGDLDWTEFTRDGERLSFHESHQPRLLDLASGIVHRIALPPRTEARKPMISAGGGFLAANLETKETSLDDKGKESVLIRNEVGLIDIEAGTLRRLAKTTRTEHFPLVSRDGKKIAFVTDLGNTYWLYLADLEDNRLVRLGPCGAGTHMRRITDDGERIVYCGDNALWSVSLRTGESRLVYRPQGIRIQEGRFSSDGRRAYFRATDLKDSRSSAVYVVDLPP